LLSFGHEPAKDFKIVEEPHGESQGRNSPY
jgi:hypothetical protein